MKHDHTFFPPLEKIEHRLFGVSDGLIRAVAAGSTSERIAQAVKDSEEWKSYHDEALSADRADEDEAAGAVPPDFIKELIKRRVAVAKSRFSAPFCAGQLVEIREIKTPEPDQLDWVIQAPLYVLLDHPGETSDLWHGWLVSADTDYATSWDFVLQEQDEPVDPECGMVQTWNPVRIYLPMAGRVVGELRSERLNAIRAMFADFIASIDPTDAPLPGRVAVRKTSTGFLVATGSPLGGQSDPRHRYQNMFHYAAEAVREPANLALAKAGVYESAIEPEAANDQAVQIENPKSEPAGIPITKLINDAVTFPGRVFDASRTLVLKWLDLEGGELAPAFADIEPDSHEPLHSTSAGVQFGDNLEDDYLVLLCEAYRDDPSIVDLKVTVARPRMLQISDRLELGFTLLDGAQVICEVTLADDRRGGLYGLSTIGADWTSVFRANQEIRVGVVQLPR